MKAAVGEGVWGEVEDGHDEGRTVRIGGVEGGQVRREVNKGSEGWGGGRWGREGVEMVDKGGGCEGVGTAGGDAGVGLV